MEQCGREWLLVTPRSASGNATGLETIEAPWSARMVGMVGLVKDPQDLVALDLAGTRGYGVCGRAGQDGAGLWR